MVHEIEKGVALLEHKSTAAKASALKASLAGLLAVCGDKILGLEIAATSLSGRFEAQQICGPAMQALKAMTLSRTVSASGKAAMTTLTIRNLNSAVKERLRVRAAQNGRSMEAELQAIIAAAVEVAPARSLDLAESIRRRFAPFDGVDLDLPLRQDAREPPTFE